MVRNSWSLICLFLFTNGSFFILISRYVTQIEDELLSLWTQISFQFMVYNAVSWWDFLIALQVHLHEQLAGMILVSHIQVSWQICGQTLCMYLTHFHDIKVFLNVLMIFAKGCYIWWISGTPTGWVISYLMVHMFGAKTILSNHPHILDKTPYNVL